MASHQVNISLRLQGLQAVQKGIESVTKTVKSLATTFAGLSGLSFAGLTLGLKSIADYGGSISDLAVQTGIGAAEFIKLEQAFKDNGLQAQDLRNTVARLNKAIDEAASGTGKAGARFKELGISIEELRDNTPEQNLKRVISQISALENSSQQAAVAMDLFGESGSKLLTPFNDLKALENAEKTLGKLPDIIERNASSFDRLSDLFGSSGVKSKQFFAGLLEQVEPTVTAMMEKFNAMDFSTVGQRLGAWLNIGLDMAKTGDLVEFMRLTVDAIIDYSKSSIQALIDWAGGTTGQVIQYSITTMLLKVSQDVLNLINEGAQFMIGTIGFLINRGMQLLWEGLEEVGNMLANSKLGRLLGGEAISEYAGARAQELGELSYSDALNEGYQIGDNFLMTGSAATYLAGLQADLDENFKTELNLDTTGAEEKISKLSEMIDQRIAQREADTAVLKQPYKAAVMPEGIDNNLNKFAGSENDIQSLSSELQINQLETERAMLDTKLSMRDVANIELQGLQKEYAIYEKMLASLEEQNVVLDQRIAELEEAAKKAKTLKEQEAIQKELVSARTQRNRNDVERSRTGLAMDENQQRQKQNANSMVGQFQKTGQTLKEEFGTLEEQVGRSTLDMSHSISSNMGGALSDVIMGTSSVEEAFANMGQAILQNIVQIITTLIAEIVVVGTMLTVLNVATGGALGSFLKIISSVLPSKGFASGGRTGNSTEWVTVGENGSEYVVSAKSPRTNDRFLDYANKGGHIEDLIVPANSTYNGTRNGNSGTSASARWSGGTTKNVTVQSNSQLRDEWKRGGVADVVYANFVRRGIV